jgi:dienelactone hydrolase
MMMRALAVLLLCLNANGLRAEQLPGTQPLTSEGDLAAKMVDGIDRYLMRELSRVGARHDSGWNVDFSSPEAMARSVQPNRERLSHILGVVDRRAAVEMQFVATTSAGHLVAEGDGYAVHAVRWPVFEGVDAEGLLLEPKGKPVACVVALPDADWTPEMLVGLAAGVPREAQFGRRLAESGCRVLVPTLINRRDTWSGNPRFNRQTNQPHREFIYRMAFEMGRHIIGYEVQKVLAAVDWFSRSKDQAPVGVFGYGEGGLLALYSGALDTRIQTVAVSGYFAPRASVWQEPIYRNVWKLLPEFGDAEVARLVAPRQLIIEASKGPEVAGPPVRPGHNEAAPGRLQSMAPETVRLEVDRTQDFFAKIPLRKERRVMFFEPGAQPGADKTLNGFLFSLNEAAGLKPDGKPPVDLRQGFDPGARQHRQFEELVAFTQRLMRDSEYRRKDSFWNKLDTSSIDKYENSCRAFRAQFWEEVIGKLPAPTEPVNARSRLAYDEPKWRGYEVTLDLYPDVFAYGILLLPRDLKPGERRPVVICQHGLEGRPQDVVDPKMKTPHYNSFGAQLAERGYIVYAPQNPYIGKDKFRVLQRKANPLGLSLFSFIVRQHERTLDWLAGLPNVDPGRMAFYGLSYGGKTAMRVPAILPRYCLSICSADFNEWIWKNVSVDFGASYMFSGEYEMVEFNLGHTFNYAEMAALIAPRPFMVERGHNDGVGIDEWVAYEYAKVRRHYAKLKIPERTAIEFFNSGHEINGQGTFAFLSRHLQWPK